MTSMLRIAAYVLKSRVRRESHARFGSGGWGREAPADHNWPALWG